MIDLILLQYCRLKRDCFGDGIGLDKGEFIDSGLANETESPKIRTLRWTRAEILAHSKSNTLPIGSLTKIENIGDPHLPHEVTTETSGINSRAGRGAAINAVFPFLLKGNHEAKP